MMSDFEIRANNILEGIRSARHRVEGFGYAADSAENSECRIVGMFITWLTACTEARFHEDGQNHNFRNSVIDKLPDIDDPNWKIYIQPTPKASLKERVKALWGVRIAYTHGDGFISKIKSTSNKEFAQNSPFALDGVSIDGDFLKVNFGVCHVAIRTIVQVQDLLIPPTCPPS